MQKCSSVVADLNINTKEIALKLLSHLTCKLEHATKVESTGKSIPATIHVFVLSNNHTHSPQLSRFSETCGVSS